MGTILDTLRETGQYDNTIIVFTSDHGDMMGSHHLLAKCVMFQEAIRVPLLIHLPGQQEQKRVNGPVSHIDLVPTLLDLMGQEVPEALQGTSLRPLMERGAEGRTTRDVVVEWQGANSGLVGEDISSLTLPEGCEDLCTVEDLQEAITDPVRTLLTPDGWKFSFSPRGEHELYNLSADRGETCNLAADESQRARVQEYCDRLALWQETTGDTEAPRIAL